ncbi:hypothetical protein B0J12DRAFT_653136 [Macrophomina phaseolina]|uniref:Uncharacterized protein n=1 Tax=Macrophomina phaseolina TaxID=35725 RepID=A0ABQ8GIV6_9PEZI|nr:hypothetical protein B0J12DRAFT_653136 [Macrophomina phaseolina]
MTCAAIGVSAFGRRVSSHAPCLANVTLGGHQSAGCLFYSISELPVPHGFGSLQPHRVPNNGRTAANRELAWGWNGRRARETGPSVVPPSARLPARRPQRSDACFHPLHARTHTGCRLPGLPCLAPCPRRAQTGKPAACCCKADGRRKPSVYVGVTGPKGNFHLGSSADRPDPGVDDDGRGVEKKRLKGGKKKGRREADGGDASGGDNKAGRKTQADGRSQGLKEDHQLPWRLSVGNGGRLW